MAITPLAEGADVRLALGIASMAPRIEKQINLRYRLIEGPTVGTPQQPDRELTVPAFRWQPKAAF